MFHQPPEKDGQRINESDSQEPSFSETLYTLNVTIHNNNITHPSVSEDMLNEQFAVSGAEERSVIKSKETVSPALQEKGGEAM